MVKAWKVILAALVIFGAGVVTGGLTVKLRQPKAIRRQSGSESVPMPWWSQQRVEFLRRMQRQLNLTAAQHARIEELLRESQERTKKLWEPIAPQLRTEYRHVRDQILQELTVEQRKKYEEVFKPRIMHKPGEPREERRKRETQRESHPDNEPPPAQTPPPSTPKP